MLFFWVRKLGWETFSWLGNVENLFLVGKVLPVEKSQWGKVLSVGLLRLVAKSQFGKIRWLGEAVGNPFCCLTVCRLTKVV